MIHLQKNLLNAESWEVLLIWTILPPHIDFLKETAGIPDMISCRFNPGGVFELGTDIMDNPGDAKYGMTRPQLTEAYKRLKDLGVKEFGLHAFLASNTVSNEYYPELARILFQGLLLRSKKKRALNYRSLTYPAVSAFLTHRTKNRMISL